MLECVRESSHTYIVVSRVAVLCRAGGDNVCGFMCGVAVTVYAHIFGFSKDTSTKNGMSRLPSVESASSAERNAVEHGRHCAPPNADFHTARHPDQVTTAPRLPLSDRHLFIIGLHGVACCYSSPS